MTTLLREIQHSVRQLIETTRPIIDFDLSVVDERLLRIAGTGSYEKYVGLNLPSKSASDHVVKSGEPLVLYNPLEHSVCQTCSVRDICLRDTSIIYPIHKEDTVIGAITIGTFQPEKIEKIKKMERELLSFLENVADFISAKAKEMEKEKRMAAILNHVNEGIILTDHQGCILLVNECMEKMGITAGKPIQQWISDNLVERYLKKRELMKEWPCSLSLPQGDFPLFVTIKPASESPSSDILFLFKNQVDNPTVKEDDSSFVSYLDQIKGKSKLLTETKRVAISAARGHSNVLIQGESGTGKELFARAIHDMSSRRKEPFIALNCAAIPDHLLESELFGYEEGAFTGAKKGGKPGKFELADKGTIFLDEIGDLSLHLQPKLLRVIEYGIVERVGGVKPIQLQVRIIAATNHDLERMIAQGNFREDLYYRLNVIHLPLPPLRKRQEDIMLLTRFFLQKYNHIFAKKIDWVSEEAEKSLLLYPWPGNVRELENAIEFAVHVEQTDVLQVSSLPVKIQAETKKHVEPLINYNLRRMEQVTIHQLLQRFGNHTEGKEQAAKEMGISLSTLYRRLREMNS
ncbi:AAA domain-containing protein [Kroppenstedtia pulmonis]|uniref:AAA domain-containing protein n=1 Tax=Kroppenstedtia pulmonis TaxID=1380685 RepID=A0A7D3Y1P7_9BACL|nr:sigma 54-interacting transcriptional regulator [Kroppenstedtia pulmonis]QKG85480.1 AAA domain-containing protein [Kroppenstedtia pulmonis]